MTDHRIANLTTKHRSVPLGLELSDVLVGRQLFLESLHWQDGGPMILLYTVTPGITEQDIVRPRTAGPGVFWLCDVADNRDTDYQDQNLSNGGLQPSDTISIGDRVCRVAPHPDTEVLALDIATPTGQPPAHGREHRATHYVDLRSTPTTTSFTELVNTWRRRRQADVVAVLRRAADGSPALSKSPDVAARTALLAAQRRQWVDLRGRITDTGQRMLDAAKDHT